MCAITRDYLDDPADGRRATWTIEAVDPPATLADDAADALARRFRAATHVARGAGADVPDPRRPANDGAGAVPRARRRRSAGRPATRPTRWAASSSPTTRSLVIEGRSPECAFWNLCLWNPFLHTYDYGLRPGDDQRRRRSSYEPDGSWHDRRRRARPRPSQLGRDARPPRAGCCGSAGSSRRTRRSGRRTRSEVGA